MKNLNTYKQFENNTYENSIFTYIKTFKNEIDLERIDKFLSGHNFFKKNAINHLQLLTFTLRQITDTKLLEKIWQMFVDYGCDINRVEPGISNIIMRVYEKIDSVEKLENYKNIFEFLFNNGIDLYHKYRFRGNFIKILSEDLNLDLFIDFFKDNEYFYRIATRYKIETKARKFKI